MPSTTNRLRTRRTVSTCTPTWAAICALEHRFAAANTILARVTSRTSAVPRRTIASNRPRRRGPNTTRSRLTQRPIIGPSSGVTPETEPIDDDHRDVPRAQDTPMPPAGIRHDRTHASARQETQGPRRRRPRRTRLHPLAPTRRDHRHLAWLLRLPHGLAHRNRIHPALPHPIPRRRRRLGLRPPPSQHRNLHRQPATHRCLHRHPHRSPGHRTRSLPQRPHSLADQTPAGLTRRCTSAIHWRTADVASTTSSGDDGWAIRMARTSTNGHTERRGGAKGDCGSRRMRTETGLLAIPSD